MDSLDEPVGAIRFGLEFGLAHGWAAARELATLYKLPVFFDTKLKDVPKTLEVGTKSLMSHSPDLFTAMVDNSAAALKGIVRGRDEGVLQYQLERKPLAVGVTVLTSITETESMSIYGSSPHVRVPQFARAAVENGFDAIVCSPGEVGLLRADSFFAETLLITPGIRPGWADANDQVRLSSPGDALRAGADLLVIGTPIIKPPSSIGEPRHALRAIAEEIGNIL